MHHLTQGQVKDLLRAIPDDRDRAALLVGYLHGLRVSEICALKVRDVADGYITVKRLKGSGKTTQALIAHSDLVLNEQQALEDIITKYRLKPSDSLFGRPGAAGRRYYDRLIKRCGALAGIEQHLQHMHVLKHSIAMHMIKPIGIENLKQYLGHKSLNSTGMYLRVSDAQASQAVAAAMQKEK
jgi:integrase